MIGNKDPAIFRSTRGALTLLQPAFGQHARHSATPPNRKADWFSTTSSHLIALLFAIDIDEDIYALKCKHNAIVVS
jgi:hypothetical protein